MLTRLFRGKLRPARLCCAVGLFPGSLASTPNTHLPPRHRAPRGHSRGVRRLIDLLIEARLLRSDATEEDSPDDAVRRIPRIEPAHEALLRQWRLLRRWLEEDFGLLATLEGVKRAARDWDENWRNVAWAIHSGTRLKDALGLDSRPDLTPLVTPQIHAYLAACSAKERDAVVRSARLAARASQSLTEEGDPDAALLSLLEFADLFTDQSVPDEILCRFYKGAREEGTRPRNSIYPRCPNI